ncbi:hypothetical protein BS50DRAFT_641642 [Corynespora cassiicola Philippines]|uniref:Uncharacterized protein n=1 Tax=Corynespora cassiicola Philippines TaxID=1448308 RepID=A0A2T2MZP7_CORCC|nr:hypothetical protein BS50DRAFT_641642 [Corynespora cassiicola Philippines]
MFRHRRPKPAPLPSLHDAPPTPTAVDVEIAAHQGSTVAMDATHERMQAAKRMPTPSLSQMIEQRTWENGQLRQELAYRQRKHGASLYLLEEVKLVVESLQQALVNFQKLNAQVEGDAGEGRK